MRWIELSKAELSFDGLKDLVLVEQFINASPEDLALFLKERKPDNVTVMADLAELPLVSALCKNKGKLRTMPVVSGVLNGKK